MVAARRRPYQPIRESPQGTHLMSRHLISRRTGEIGVPLAKNGCRPLTASPDCLTLSGMKTATLSIRLDDRLDRLLTKASRQAGRSRSEVAREALRRQLRLAQFESVRRRMMPFAEARGFLTDDDVFANP